MNKEVEQKNTPGFTLGIISLLIAIFTFVTAISIANSSDFKILSFFSDSSNTVIAFVLTIVPAILGIIGVAKAIPSLLNQKTTKRMIATILNGVALLLCIIQFIILISA